MAREQKQSTSQQEKKQGEPIGVNRVHAESIGDIWLTLTGQVPQKIMPDVVATVLHAGGTRPVWQWKSGGNEYVVMAWPEDQPVRAAVLLSGPDGSNLRPVSAVPLLEGVPNNLLVDQIHPRQEGQGADVAAEMLEGKSPMWFFDPLYMRDKDDLTPGVTHTFWLAGVALAMRKALLDHITVTSGLHYEEYAARWLAENPGKKSQDVPPLKVEIKDRHMIMPGHHFGEYQMRGVVQETEDWQFDKMPINAVYLSFPFDGREPLQLVVYASKFVLGEYEPKKGDEIEAYVWLQGRVVDMPQAGPEISRGAGSN